MKRQITLYFVLTLIFVACSGKQTLELPRGANALGLAWAPDGSAIAVLYLLDSKALVEWRQYPNGNPVWQVTLEGEIFDSSTPLVISLRGDKVFIPLGNRVQIYSNDGTLLSQFSFQGAIWIPALSNYHPTHLALLTVRANGQVESLYLEQVDQNGKLIAAPVYLLDDPETQWWWRPFSPDGRHLVYPMDYQTLRVQDLENGASFACDLSQALSQNQVKSQRAIWAVALHPNGEEVALGLHVRNTNQLMLMRVNAITGSVLSETFLSNHDEEAVIALSYSPSGRYLAAGAMRKPPGEIQYTLLLYDLSSARDATVLCDDVANKCCIHALAFSPDERRLATTCGEQITLWEIKP